MKVFTAVRELIPEFLPDPFTNIWNPVRMAKKVVCAVFSSFAIECEHSPMLTSRPLRPLHTGVEVAASEVVVVGHFAEHEREVDTGFLHGVRLPRSVRSGVR